MVIHLYFMGSLYFLVWWLFLFLWRKSYQTEMLIASMFGIILGPLVEAMHLKDWWHPVYLNNFPIKIEDVIFGFAVLGISAVLYQEIRGLKERQERKLVPSIGYDAVLIIVGLFLLFGFFYFFGISSFWTSIIASVAVSLFILARRPDLFFSMLMSGVLLVVLALPFYIVALWLNPLWIQEQWYTNKLSGVQLFSIPIEEIAWYFFVGFSFSALWEFIRGFKFLKNLTIK